ncbi:hypothetical protein ACFLS1_07690 [Verrucomicrobiota bacterium]
MGQKPKSAKRKKPSRKELEKKWRDSIRQSTSKYGHPSPIRISHNFIEYYKIGHELSLSDLRLIVSEFSSDRLPVLFSNLKDMALVYAPENDEKHYSYVLQYFRLFLKSFRANDQTFMGRKTEAWLNEYALNSEGKWFKKRRESLARNPRFVKQREEIEAGWPQELIAYTNPFLLGTRITEGITSIKNICQSSAIGSVPADHELSADFRKLITGFVVTWNLQFVVRLDDGSLDCVPATVWCASDSYSQGTYVFIPRYYNWSRIKNAENSDFADLRTLLDDVYEKFKPPKGPLFADKAERCCKFVKAKLARRKPTMTVVTALVKEWCNINDHAFDKSKRVSSDIQVKKYVAFALRTFDITS